MASRHFPLYCLLFSTLLSLALSSTVKEDKWTSSTCNAQVTDILCCGDSQCSSKPESECQDDGTCLWENSKCKIYRDKDSNVCCQSGNSDICGDVTTGKCPSIFEVPADCCTDVRPLEAKNGLVCCNTPCADAQNSNGKCNTPEHCSNPNARSLGGGLGGPGLHGYQIFSPQYISNYPTYGYAGNSYYELPGKEHSVGDTKEITVDDVMNAMLESLESDKDAYVYESEIHTDPYFGKAKYGGHLGGINLPDPNIFLKQIYGNPYGLSRGQFGFPGQGWPSAHGVNPGSGHGYLQNGHSGYGYSSPSYGNGNYQQSHSYGYQPSHNYGYNQYQTPNYGYEYQQSQDYGYSQSPNYGLYNSHQPSQGYGNAHSQGYT